ncbi:A24 family peptidase [Halomonas vilamensis]|uniref:Prepilin leader peptidase/N-methyltransferase n=1 Tax=Vreelandella vilamensis TaxID=531309 RepID=A0ABU1H2D3_9GAMM|nr:A24 family peptidase [Halomonas vilamensis]MDR5898454.1 A24 family peptidase [Halomonas vilamensis]
MHSPPLIFWLIALLLGLCVGSFLNVVITRLPVMLMQQWRAEARAALELPEETPERFNIAFPASMCPRCRTPIKWHDNLPLIGWLKRRGRCAACQARISPQYPQVELFGAAIALASLALYGVTLQALFIAGACYALLAMAVIDLRTQLLPDLLTLPLLWAGLIYQLLFQPLMLPSAVIGAIAGYLMLWSVYWLFKLVTGREGMGYGDFKLLAALGAWLGWQFLPMVLIIAAGLGAIVGIALQLSVKDKRGVPMAFGPFLALAGWVSLLGGDGLMALYLQFSGL